MLFINTPPPHSFSAFLLIPFILARLAACQDEGPLAFRPLTKFDTNITISTTVASSSSSSSSLGSASGGAAKACGLLSQRFPDLVAFPGSQQYDDDEHHAAYSSQQNSTCTIEPTSIGDVSEILKIVGQDDIRSPFAVKSGGHAYNLGFSSTPGVLISMARFNQVTYTPPTSHPFASSSSSPASASSHSPASSFGPSPSSSLSSSSSSDSDSASGSQSGLSSPARSSPSSSFSSRSNSFSSPSPSHNTSALQPPPPPPPTTTLDYPHLGTITLGTGLTWDVAFARIEELGIGLGVAGGRIPGIGVGGFTLGGGYSWHTDQYGLSLDTVASFDVVLPTGEIVKGVSEGKRPEVFWGLKGGMNNLGIVTAITYNAFRQDLVYGGSITFAQNVSSQVYDAVAQYDATNTDPKSQTLLTFAGVAGQPILQLFLFYDAPQLPSTFHGYDAFFAIPALATQVGGGQKFSSYLTGTFGDGSLGIGTYGIAQHVVPIRKYTPAILSVMAEACTNLSASIPSLLSTFAQENAHLVGIEAVAGIVGVVSVSAEPFINAFAHAGKGLSEGVFSGLGLDLEGDFAANSDSNSSRNSNNTSTTVTFPDPYPGSNIALYAHSPQHPTTPASILVAYSLPDAIQASEASVRALQDGVFKGVLGELTSEIVRVAVAEGQSLGGVIPGGDVVGSTGLDGQSGGISDPDSVPPLSYPNYAFADTPLEAMYGPTNVRRMRRLVKRVDPQGVMKLTGGFLFQ